MRTVRVLHAKEALAVEANCPEALNDIGLCYLQDGDLDRSWDCLKRFGNLSSASVLLVLEEVLTNHTPEVGTYGILLAMGPGFCTEVILLRW